MPKILPVSEISVELPNVRRLTNQTRFTEFQPVKLQRPSRISYNQTGGDRIDSSFNDDCVVRCERAKITKPAVIAY